MTDRIHDLLVSKAKYLIQNPVDHRDYENTDPEYNWDIGFSQGYDSGKLSLIEELLGIVEMERIKREL